MQDLEWLVEDEEAPRLLAELLKYFAGDLLKLKVIRPPPP